MERVALKILVPVRNGSLVWLLLCPPVETEGMETELTYLFLFVVLIAVPLCQITGNNNPSRRGVTGDTPQCSER